MRIMLTGTICRFMNYYFIIYIDIHARILCLVDPSQKTDEGEVCLSY